jgi:hypothetical protein
VIVLLTQIVLADDRGDGSHNLAFLEALLLLLSMLEEEEHHGDQLMLSLSSHLLNA